MDAAAARIMDKLSQGTLPTDDPVKVWGGKGNGRSCEGCDELISSSEAEHDVEDAGRAHAAVSCRLRGAVAGVEAGDAEVVAAPRRKILRGNNGL
jgi:hypothetical protein